MHGLRNRPTIFLRSAYQVLSPQGIWPKVLFARLRVRRSHTMPPKASLPLPPGVTDCEAYISSLLSFSTSNDLLQTLCGGVHILDFFTKEPDLYATILPEEWRTYFDGRNIGEILDLLLRDDPETHSLDIATHGISSAGVPPLSLLEYIQDVRRHCLDRTFLPPQRKKETNPSRNPKGGVSTRTMKIGMKPKKVHEVENFAMYVDNLTSYLDEQATPEWQSEAKSRDNSGDITHLVDFGSGQNYLGRTLACHPYNHNIVAVESKKLNIEGAQSMDITAKVAPKRRFMRDKKLYRLKLQKEKEGDVTPSVTSEYADLGDTGDETTSQKVAGIVEQEMEDVVDAPIIANTATDPLAVQTNGSGTIQYIEHKILNGDLSPVVAQIKTASPRKPLSSISHPETPSKSSSLPKTPEPESPALAIISLHSCGQLTPHALSSLLLNPTVNAVAVIGCCYNLITERFGGPTTKIPELRTLNPRLLSTSRESDPLGFPLSERLATYPTGLGEDGEQERGIKLNITARMMACQAPSNWTQEESDNFFTRHFYRALLQRIFFDYGVVKPVSAHEANTLPKSPAAPSCTEPIIIGSLRKTAYVDFETYTYAAIEKILGMKDASRHPSYEALLKLQATLNDDEIKDYLERYIERKKHLSIIWSMMAYSAGVVESLIVTDRLLYLQEREEVKEAWVEAVFDYRESPRNLCVVGIKR
jgi:Methyltransferase domain